ncbi:hypothetical protein F4813DRAFT_364912 [Daldinia decipiens]|uniref:uncharacterized protein n=1 Tax=Daldinia decipiens TaxID=326647 RepID=UPI0020C547D3|nr:uncharacterized protein F4813DRAFT_364912 [Daldinia decipiens]KAI1656280.1 hypothetical protein F4813DRAFT_364912 [Daldinia decipiens]
MSSRQLRRRVRSQPIATVLPLLESPTGASAVERGNVRVSSECGADLVVDSSRSSREVGNRPLPNWHAVSWLHWVSFPVRPYTYHHADSVPELPSVHVEGKCRHQLESCSTEHMPITRSSITFRLST